MLVLGASLTCQTKFSQITISLSAVTHTCTQTKHSFPLTPSPPPLWRLSPSLYWHARPLSPTAPRGSSLSITVPAHHFCPVSSEYAEVTEAFSTQSEQMWCGSDCSPTNLSESTEHCYSWKMVKHCPLATIITQNNNITVCIWLIPLYML